jgi:hypothetical protein
MDLPLYIAMHRTWSPHVDANNDSCRREDTNSNNPIGGDIEDAWNPDPGHTVLHLSCRTNDQPEMV